MRLSSRQFRFLFLFLLCVCVLRVILAMQLPRRVFVQTAFGVCSLVHHQSHTQEETDTLRRQTQVYHTPPPPHEQDTDYYNSNPTVFGKILKGDLPAIVLSETPHLLAFQDIRPRAKLHALIIPKQYIESVFDLTPPPPSSSSKNNNNNTTTSIDDYTNLAMLMEMQQVAHDLIQREFPMAYQQGDYRLCFHIPPFNSQNHLHLHVLAPLRDMNPLYQYIKYNTHTRWSTSLTDVLQRLQHHQSAVPYSKPKQLFQWFQ